MAELDADAGTAAPTEPKAPGRRGLVRFLMLLALAVLVLDQATKMLAIERLEPGKHVPLLGDLLGFSLVFNPGAAFSFAEGQTWFFTLAAVVVAVAIVRVSRRLGSRGWALALGALLGGNLGNLADRLFREPGFARGHVVDFIKYGDLFVGNVADIAIVVSALGIAVLTFRGVGIDGLAVGGGSGAADAEDPASADAEDAATGGAEGDPDGASADDAAGSAGADAAADIDDAARTDAAQKALRDE